MGSHGLGRVFMAVAPVAALIAQYSIHRLMTFDLKPINIALKTLIILGSFFIAFPGAQMPFPWKWNAEPSIRESPGNTVVMKAMNYIDSTGLGGHALVHQLPQINVKKDWDPFEVNTNVAASTTFHISSIDKRPGQDWLPDSAVVLWDNFHARRDAAMPLSDLRKLADYKEIAYFPSPSDTIYEMRLFIKTR